MLKYTNLTAIIQLLLILPLIGCSTTGGESPRTEVSERTEISNNVHTESVKVGNTKTKNYHIEAAEFRPTQLTQVVLNVPKLPKYLRKTRPPSQEELVVKQRILEVFNEVRKWLGGMYLPPLDHLGTILEALNPKYISTERVVRAVFGDHQLPAFIQAQPEHPKPEYNANHYQASEGQMRSVLESAQRARQPAVSASASASDSSSASASAYGAASAAAAAVMPDPPAYRYSYDEESPPDFESLADQEPEYEVNALAGRYFQFRPSAKEYPVKPMQELGRRQAKSSRLSSSSRYRGADSNLNRRYYLPPGSGHHNGRAFEQQYARY